MGARPRSKSSDETGHSSTMRAPALKNGQPNFLMVSIAVGVRSLVNFSGVDMHDYLFSENLLGSFAGTGHYEL